ncbi:MAG: diguanylate cyclase, partial [Aromatoleum sp.]|nr:diguanylate cyclase [Aromatoleum sp.]
MRPLLAIPAFGVMLVAAVWTATLLQLATSERAAVTAALRDTENFVATYEQYARRAIKNADRTALLVKREFERDGAMNLPELVAAGLVDRGDFAAVRITDALGIVVASSLPSERPFSVADRDYFHLHAAQDTGRLDISKPVVGRATGRTVILLTRRMNHRDGTFAGTVSLAVTPDYFTDFYQEAKLGNRGALSILGLDGVFRARRVGHESASTPEAGNKQLVAQAQLAAEGSYEGVSPIDGTLRLIAYRKVADYPFIVMAAQAKDEVLAEFHRSRDRYLLIATATSAVILAFFAVVTVLAVRLQRNRADLKTQRGFLQTLVHNLPIGVAVRSMKAADHGRYLLWNESNEVVFGVKAERALGKAAAEVMPGELAARIEEWDRELLASPMVQEVMKAVDVAGRGRRIIRGIHAPIFGADGAVEYLMSIASDVTEEQASADDLRLASKVFETTADGIMLTDGDDRVIMVNPAFSRLTGYGPGEIVGQTLAESPFRPIDPAASEARMVRLHSEGFVTDEVQRFRKDGTPLFLWVTGTCVRDAAGAIVNYVRVFSDISPLKEAQRKLEQLASFDTLTGLPNRRLLDDRLDQALRRALRLGGGAALLFIDVDGLKEVNDTYGHDVGDLLLQDIAARLRECVRASDSVGRYGGDEFVIVLEDGARAADALCVCQRIVAALADPVDVGGHRVRRGASIGIALYPQDGTDGATLLKNADVAMYEAKKGGRNRFVFFARPVDETPGGGVMAAGGA